MIIIEYKSIYKYINTIICDASKVFEESESPSSSSGQRSSVQDADVSILAPKKTT